MDDRIRLGVSACILGERVRFDGGHKRNRFVTDILGQYAEFVPVCPEVEAGYSIPRETFRLVGTPECPRFITSRTKVDHTEPMTSWARSRVEELVKEDLCGFIFQKGSPSSGMERVKVYDKNGVPTKKGVGMFARAFMDRFPRMPVEEDGRLHDDGIREHFIERIFAFHRWKMCCRERRSRSRLVAFHTRSKLLIMAHSPKHYREMGRFVANLKGRPIAERYDRYEALFLDALAVRATVRKHVNVLQHVAGYFKRDTSADERQEMVDLIAHYRAGDVPLIVPITLLNHYVRKFDEPYLKDQVYLNPHPIELKLRNHA